MLQLSDSPGFLVEPGQRSRILFGSRMQRLDGNGNAKLAVLAAVDHTHTPNADAVQDAVIPQYQSMQAANLDARRLVIGQESASHQAVQEPAVVCFALHRLSAGGSQGFIFVSVDDSFEQESRNERRKWLTR